MCGSPADQRSTPCRCRPSGRRGSSGRSSRGSRSAIACRCGSFVGREAVPAADVSAGGAAWQGDQDPRFARLADRRIPAALDDARRCTCCPSSRRHSIPGSRTASGSSRWCRAVPRRWLRAARGGSPIRCSSTSRSFVNGRARTTWSACTSWVAAPQENVQVYPPCPRLRTASSRWPRRTSRPGSRRMSSQMSWSLPSRMCHFSSVADSCGRLRGCLPLGTLS